MRGLSRKKSRLRVLWSATSFSATVSLVMCEGIWSSGILSVATAMRKWSRTNILRAFFPSPTCDSMYSVWPGKGVPSAVSMVALWTGAVTSASILPSLRSARARSRATRAALPDSWLGWPNSILSSSSPKQLIMLSTPSRAMSADSMSWKLVWLPMAFLW